MRNPRKEPVSPPSTLLYVYCAVRGTVAARTVAKLPTMPGGAALRVLPLTDDISLIVADVPAAAYKTEAIEARLTDLDWVSRCGIAHHAVADTLAPKHTIVPMRLFTLFSSEARAFATLAKAARPIDEALERVKGRAEWVLRIGKPDPALLKTAGKGAKSAGPTTGTSFLTLKAGAKRAASELAERVRREAAAVFTALKSVADQSSEKPSDQTAGLLLDAAFLVPMRKTATFKRELAARAEPLLADGCRVSLTGPWPPYTFVTLDDRASNGR